MADHPAEQSDSPAGGGVTVAPVARSPIGPAAPTEIVAGWEVSGRRSTAPLRLADRSPLAKVLVRADDGSPTAIGLAVPFGRCARRPDGVLVIGSGPGEWLLLGALGSAGLLASGVPGGDAAAGGCSVVDLTHGRALVRLTGATAATMLAKVCAVDLRERVTPNGSAFRTAVAGLAVDVVRDDLDESGEGGRSYLLHCERSSGQYLFAALLDAGREFGIDIDGFDAR